VDDSMNRLEEDPAAAMKDEEQKDAESLEKDELKAPAKQ
jgi:hypothetical protein